MAYSFGGRHPNARRQSRCRFRISYTHYLAEIDEGRSNTHHRDVNRGFANELGGLPQGEVAPCPPIQATIETDYGLPAGSVRLLRPDGTPQRRDASIASRRDEYCGC